MAEDTTNYDAPEWQEPATGGTTYAEDEQADFLNSLTPEMRSAYEARQTSIKQAARVRSEASGITMESALKEDTGAAKDLADIKKELLGTPGKITETTDAVVQAKALSSLVSNLVKAWAAVEGSKRGIDTSGVDVKSGVDWDLVLKGKLGAVEEQRRQLEGRAEESRMSLSDKIRQRREQKELEARGIEAAGEVKMSTMLQSITEKRTKRMEARQTKLEDRQSLLDQAKFTKDELTIAEREKKGLLYIQGTINAVAKEKYNGNTGRVKTQDLIDKGLDPIVVSDMGVESQSIWERLTSHKQTDVEATIEDLKNKVALVNEKIATKSKEFSDLAVKIKTTPNTSAKTGTTTTKPATPAPAAAPAPAPAAGTAQSKPAEPVELLSDKDEKFIGEYLKRNPNVTRADAIKTSKIRGFISK